MKRALIAAMVPVMLLPAGVIDSESLTAEPSGRLKSLRGSLVEDRSCSCRLRGLCETAPSPTDSKQNAFQIFDRKGM